MSNESFRRGRELPVALARPEYERALLGALLSRPSNLDALPGGFVGEHFSEGDHADLYDALRALDSRTSAAAYEVGRFWAGDDQERRVYFGDILAATAGSLPADVAIRAKTIIELHHRRILVAAADALRSAIFEDGPVGIAHAAAVAMREALDAADGGDIRGRRAISLGEAVADAITQADRARAAAGFIGLQTGFRELDDVLGGLEPGTVTVVGARPAMGKSALALQIAMNVAAVGCGAAYVSLEMEASQLGRRALALEASVPLRVLKRGELSNRDAEAVVEAQRRMREWPLLIEDEGGLTAETIAVRARAMARKIPLSLLVVDHAHIVRLDREAARNPTFGVGQVSAAIKALAKRLEVPILLLAQLSRESERREDHRPTIADLRQSGDLEQDAEAVMLLHREEVYAAREIAPTRDRKERDDAFEARLRDHERRIADTKGRAQVIIPKVRDGEPGSVDLRFDGPYAAFRSAS